ncbi:hypothetical protein KFE25_000648 [Diacronema lutheri]|uniref:Uncharacterized protein n=1 Tax=Diacronema lutheri TaxID=2081491 RepID=A0A8J6CA82_DIALT|nr:hypothetical protein KFE25_000648 [Diacronema lutheri]
MDDAELRRLLAERDADAEVMLDRMDELEAQLAERDDDLRRLDADNARLSAALADTERGCLDELGALRALVRAVAPDARREGEEARARALRAELRAAEETAARASLAGERRLRARDAEAAVALAALRGELADAESEAVCAVMDAAEAALDAHDAHAVANALRARADGGALDELRGAHALLFEDRRLLVLELDELRVTLADERAAAAAAIGAADARADAAERLAERARVRAARGDSEVSPPRAFDERARDAAALVGEANRRAARANGAAGSPVREQRCAMSPPAGAPDLRTAAPTPTGGRRLAVERGLRAQTHWRSELAAGPGVHAEARAARAWAEEGNERAPAALFASPERKRWQAEVAAFNQRLSARLGAERARAGAGVRVRCDAAAELSAQSRAAPRPIEPSRPADDPGRARRSMLAAAGATSKAF